MRAAQRLAEAMRVNAPGCGPSALEALAVIAQAPSTGREIEEATGMKRSTVTRALAQLRPHLRGGRLVDRAPLVAASKEPGSRSWRFQLTPEGMRLLSQAGLRWQPVVGR